MSIRQAIGEALSQGLCRAAQAGGWDFVEHPLAGGLALRTYRPGHPLTLQCMPSTTAIEFVRHAWSGKIRITAPGVEDVVSLSYDEGTEIFRYDLPSSDHDFEVTIEGLPIDAEDASHREAWLLGLIYDAVPRPTGRSILLNSGSRLIYGDWGEFLVLSNDQVIPDAIIREGAWAPKDIKVFKDHVPVGGTVLDIGANFGHHAVVFSKLVGAQGLVIAIEAQRVMYQLVHANSVLNRRDNIVPLNAAAGDKSGFVKLYPIAYDGENNFGALGINNNAERGEDQGEDVAVHPLDELLPPYLDGRTVSFVKIDVQAYELFVLRGMAGIIARDRPTIFVEISPVWMKKAGYDYREIYELLRAHGYGFVHGEGIQLGADGTPDVPLDEDIEWDLLAIWEPSRGA